MSETYIGAEPMEPDGYLQPKRYRVTCKCLICENEFSWVTTKLGGKDKPCPRKACKEALLDAEANRRAANMLAILESGQAPAHIGANTGIRAIDKTAEIVMEDHHLTDLRTDVRVGEAVAPKLPPQQQAQADSFFGNGGLKNSGVNSRQAQLLGRRAMAGAFRGMAVNPAQVVPNTPGTPVLRKVDRPI